MGQLESLRLHLTETHLETDWLEEQRPSQLSPEKNLLFAVLADAIHVSLGKATTQKTIRERAAARCWITSFEHDSTFCFISICEILNFDPAYIKQAVMAQPGWPKKELHG